MFLFSLRPWLLFCFFFSDPFQLGVTILFLFLFGLESLSPFCSRSARRVMFANAPAKHLGFKSVIRDCGSLDARLCRSFLAYIAGKTANEVEYF